MLTAAATFGPPGVIAAFGIGFAVASIFWVFALRWAWRKSIPVLEPGERAYFYDRSRKYRTFIGRIVEVNHGMGRPSTIEIQDESAFLEKHRVRESDR